MIIIIMINIIT